jgi:peroxiredoxin
MWRRTPVVLAFFVTRGSKCVREVDRLVPAARRHPGVQVLAISLRGDRGDVRDLVRSHRWPFPVAYDEDGRLANFYGVAVCPQLTYVRRGGTVAGTNVGDLSRERLERQVAALEEGRRVQ